MKRIVEYIVDPTLREHEKFPLQPSFDSDNGINKDRIVNIFQQLADSDNNRSYTYGVAQTQFDIMNGELLCEELKYNEGLKCITKRYNDYVSIMKMVYNTPHLRNRNALTPSPIDSYIITNLLHYISMPFPGFKYGMHATHGYDCLSSILYDYKIDCNDESKQFVWLCSKNDDTLNKHVLQCAQRLHLKTLMIHDNLDYQLEHAFINSNNTCVVAGTFETIMKHASTLSQYNMQIHMHITDTQYRNIILNDAHMNFDTMIKTISIERGVYNNAFGLHRSYKLRDHHISVPKRWQCVYISQNEAGSSNLRAILEDFVLSLLGKNTIKEIASNLPPMNDMNEHYQLKALELCFNGETHEVFSNDVPMNEEKVRVWAMNMYKQQGNRESLSKEVLHMVSAFTGGQSCDKLHGFITCGGTRSITRALECVKIYGNKHNSGDVNDKPTILTANPHFAVERNQSKLGLNVIRIVRNGVMDVEALKHYVQMQKVVAVFVQALSWTDGVTDPIEEVFEIIEHENKMRQKLGQPLVIMICDCCLALSILIHHKRLRILDYKDCITPRIITTDPHKHIGLDVGFSVVLGIGCLHILNDSCIRIGEEPSFGDLVRACANMYLVGYNGYMKLYKTLGAKVYELTTKLVSEGGLCVIYNDNRLLGSIVFTVGDPYNAMTYYLRKKLHYHMYPMFDIKDKAYQCGFQVSVTARYLEEVAPKKLKIDVLYEDIIRAKVASTTSCLYRVCKRIFSTNSTLPTLLFGGLDPLVLSYLPGDVFGHDYAATLLRRHQTARMDK